MGTLGPKYILIWVHGPLGYAIFGAFLRPKGCNSPNGVRVLGSKVSKKDLQYPPRRVQGFQLLCCRNYYDDFGKVSPPEPEPRTLWVASVGFNHGSLQCRRTVVANPKP